MPDKKPEKKAPMTEAQKKAAKAIRDKAKLDKRPTAFQRAVILTYVHRLVARDAMIRVGELLKEIFGAVRAENVADVIWLGEKKLIRVLKSAKDLGNIQKAFVLPEEVAFPEGEYAVVRGQMEAATTAKAS